MSQLTEHVSLTITADTLGQARAGFGVALALSYTAAWAERTRTYGSLSDVAADFPVTTSPEYLEAQAYFGQSPHPEQLIVGRCALKPTLAYTIGVQAVGLGAVYAVAVAGTGVTGTTAQFTSLADLSGTLLPRTTNTLTLTAHGMSTGDGPYYVSNTGGALPTGLVANTPYWIINITANTFQFASSKANALALTPVALTGDGSGTQTILRGSTNQDVVIQQLVQGLNAVPGANYTAATSGSAGSLVMTVTATVAGAWFSLSLNNFSLLTSKQTQADPGVVTDLLAIQVENDNWYALTTRFNSQAVVLAAAAWIETQSKIYLVDLVETDSVNVAVGSSPTDTLYRLFQAKYNRTAGSFYPTPATMFAAAWLGRVLPDDPGSETWKGKTLSGVVAVNLTTTQRANLRARKANTYTTIGSEDKTWEGTVAGGTFGFIDVTRGLDWLEDDMTKGVFDAVFSGEKLPYTDAGIAVVRNEVKASLKRALERGIIADDPPFVISVPAVADIDDADKALRNLPDVKFSATLAGAIHTVAITGVVSV